MMQDRYLLFLKKIGFWGDFGRPAGSIENHYETILDPVRGFMWGSGVSLLRFLTISDFVNLGIHPRTFPQRTTSSMLALIRTQWHTQTGKVLKKKVAKTDPETNLQKVTQILIWGAL